MKSITSILAMTVAFVGLVFANAAEYTWTPTAAGTTYDWNIAGNWGGTAFPNAAGDVANLTNDIAGAQTVRLRQNITVGRINLGDHAGVVYATTIANASAESSALTFDSGVAGMAARIVLSATSNATHKLNVPAVLNRDLVVDLTGADANNKQNIEFGNLVSLGANTLRIVNGIYSQKQVEFMTGCDFSGDNGMIVNDSSSILPVNGKKNFSGVVVANGLAFSSNQSTFTFTYGGFTNAAELVINGMVSNSNVRLGGGVHVGQNSNTGTNPGQLLPYRRVTFNGGYMVRSSLNATAGTANDWQQGLEWAQDDIDVLDFHSGYNFLEVGAGGNTPGTKVNVATLARSRGASVYLFGVNDVRKNLLAANISEFLKGAGGSAASTTMSVIPWAGVYTSGGYVSPAGFATYEAVTGFRALDRSTEYATSITAGSTHNVSVNEVTLAADATVNALLFTGGSDNIGSGRTLTISSGGIFFTGSGTIGASGNAAAGTLDFGVEEGVVSVHANNASTIGAVIAGVNGLSKIQTGTLTITGNNTVQGPVHVGGGTLRVGDGTYASNLSSGDVDVHAGAKLRISCDNAIVNSATVRLYHLGPNLYFGKMEIDPGRNETVRFLFLGDEPMAAGTYGGTGSGATNILPNHFTGTGILTVSSNAAALGGTTLIVIK